jgi:drug/metabolite transporter (DMT)-like permease
VKNLLDQLVAHKLGALLLLLIAAGFEAYGDSWFQSGLYRSSGTVRAFAFLAGAASLATYGFVVNLPQWDFGKLLGIYVVFFFLVAQLIAWLRFHQPPTVPVLAGGFLIVAGGVVISVFGK